MIPSRKKFGGAAAYAFTEQGVAVNNVSIVGSATFRSNARG
jgi:hypothetical protein